MAWKEWLAHRRNRRLARIAREKGLACPDCGSSDPVPEEGGIGARPDGGAHVRMCCEACEGASEMALGLHSSGERPEEPGPG